VHRAIVTKSRPPVPRSRVRFLCATNDYTWLAKTYRHNDVGPFEQLLIDGALCAFGTYPGTASVFRWCGRRTLSVYSPTEMGGSAALVMLMARVRFPAAPPKCAGQNQIFGGRRLQ
jgi:hypothetical protein